MSDLTFCPSSDAARHAPDAPLMARPTFRLKHFIPVVAVCALLLATSASQAEPATDRMNQLIHMVRQDCGSCHGLHLDGGLGPALTPDALAGKPAEGLTATIYRGRPGTPMPPFSAHLSEEEAAWIVNQLMHGFPHDPGAPPR